MFRALAAKINLCFLVNFFFFDFALMGLSRRALAAANRVLVHIRPLVTAASLAIIYAVSLPHIIRPKWCYREEPGYRTCTSGPPPYQPHQLLKNPSTRAAPVRLPSRLSTPAATTNSQPNCHRPLRLEAANAIARQ
jgi:hypothetical protein